MAVPPSNFIENSVVPFPPQFWWGTSLSAHQAEGGNTNNWTRWEEQPHRIKNADRSARAANHWEKFEEDFNLLTWLHANTHRLSVEWSRLEPRPGQWNQEAEKRYIEMLRALKARNIRPVVCLFHFTLPLWVEDQGGFENPQMVEAFIGFVERCQKAFGHLVSDWLTMNEPVVYALGAYAAGLTPPGIKDLKRALMTVVSLMRAHGEAYHVLKAADPRATVSFAHHLRIFQPRLPLSPLDQAVAKISNEVFNWSWYQAIKTGHIQLHVPTFFHFEQKCPETLGAMDYVGFNYYSRDHIQFSPFSHGFMKLTTPNRVPKTDMGWEIYPDGLRSLLRQIKQKGLGRYPILLTENGLADANDSRRPQFIYDHLRIFLETCRREDLTPMGYLHWSLIDNFEWIDGFNPRFGLFEINYETQSRSPRVSAHYFREMGRRWQLLAPTEVSPRGKA